MQNTMLVFCRNRQQGALIARTLRYREYRCVPVDFELTAEKAADFCPQGLIIAADTLDGLDEALLEMNVPLAAARRRRIPIAAL